MMKNSALINSRPLQIEIPVPEHAPEPGLPGSLPEINASDDEQDGFLRKVRNFVDSDEIVPEKEEPGKASPLASEAGLDS